MDSDVVYAGWDFACCSRVARWAALGIWDGDFDCGEDGPVSDAGDGDCVVESAGNELTAGWEGEGADRSGVMEKGADFFV